MELAMEAGADDVKPAGDKFEVLCAPENYNAVAEALTAAEIEPENAQVTRLPLTTVEIDVDTARTVLKLMEQLDDHDDVQGVMSNFSLSDEALAELSKD
jgi:transcriptional/translational regulatory protein YebC/TACO1